MKNGVSTEQLAKDLRRVARDAEYLLKATADEATDQVREARSRLASTLASAEESVVDFQERAVVATGKMVSEHPLQSLGAAMGIGALIGFLAGWSGSRR